MRWTTALLLVALTTAPAAAGPNDQPEPPATPTETIVGGTLAQPGDWPDTAGILFGNSVQCTGVLIAPTLALTAGHCAGGIDGIILDTTDLSDPQEIIAVEQEIEYPNSWRNYDATLLILAEPATVTPRTIANGCIRDQYLVDGAPVAIAGYGAFDADGTMYDDYLRKAETTITDADCSDIAKGCNENVSPNGELGAGGDGIDTCFGDSGGPLYLLTPAGAFLAGLTSRAWDDAQTACTEGGVYVRPDAIMDWIEEQSGIDLPDASCNIAPAPTAELIEAESGGDGSTMISPNDPDTGDSHTFSIGMAPAQGTAEVADDGLVTYHAGDFVGEDQFTVVVTDSGDPNKSGTVTVLVLVSEGEGGCGCRAGADPGSAGGMALLAFAVLVVLRRRR